jgi:hypothetical protein
MSSVQAINRHVLTRRGRRAWLTAVLIVVVVMFAAFRCEPLKKPIPQTVGISHIAPGSARPAAIRGKGALVAWRAIDVSRLNG